MFLRLTIAGWLGVLGCCCAVAAEKVPVPTAAEQAEAQRTVDEVFGQEWAAAQSPEQKKQLAKKLLSAAKTTEEAHLRFCVLENVERLAIAARDFSLAASAIDVMATSFDVIVDDRRVQAYEKVAAASKSPADYLAVAKAGIEELDAAHASGKLDIAIKYGRLAFAAAKRGRDPATVKTLEERAALLVAKKKAADSLAGLEAAVAADPNDGGAHQQLGEILCFSRNDWTKGLPHLVKAADARLAALAKRDSVGPTDVKERVSIADAWLDWSKTAGKDHVAGLHGRALHWYQQSLPNLSGLTKVRIEKQIRDLAKTAATASGANSGTAATTEVGSGIYAQRSPAIYTTLQENDKDQLAAIDKGLEWLAAHQRADGAWSFDHRYGPSQSNPGSMTEGTNASTAMALLPLLAAGNTHKDGKYRAAVTGGLTHLVKSIKLRAGGLGELTDPSGTFYSHGLATIALCEAYGMTGDPALKEPAQSTIRYIVAAQDPVGGGWRYAPRQPGDISVGGWQLQALYVGHDAGLVVPVETLRKASGFLDGVQTDAGAAYGYTSPGQGISTSAVGLHSRQLLGWKVGEQAALKAGLDKMVASGPSRTNMYFNYYASYAVRGSETHNAEFRKELRKVLLAAQSLDGKETGSWYIQGDHGSERGGRIYCTSMALLALQASYRYAAP